MKPAFLDPLDLRALDDGRTWVVLDPMRYRSASGMVYTVPRGFMTDLTSTPRAIWAIFPPTGLYQQAAVLHDWLYWKQSVPRSVADAMLYEAMETCGVGWIDRHVIWSAVRLGGWRAWAANARDAAKALADPIYSRIVEIPYALHDMAVQQPAKAAAILTAVANATPDRPSLNIPPPADEQKETPNP